MCAGLHRKAGEKRAAMPVIRRKTGKKSPCMKDGNPELRKVVEALRSLVKKFFPSTRITVNSWGIRTFEAAAPSI
jgi:hypothetical protein